MSTASLFPFAKRVSPMKPRASVIDALPEDAVVMRARTRWQHIIDLLVNNGGQWVELHRRYGDPTNAVNTARKTLEAEHGPEMASHLDSAYRKTDDEQFCVFLRLAVDDDEVDDGEE